MKKQLALALAVALTVAATSAFAGLAAKTGINGSLHDINTFTGDKDNYGRTCVFCHTPHNALAPTGVGDVNYPLWNKSFATGTFAAYKWATPENSITDLVITDPLVGPSRLCMSCHDGATASDQHGSNGTMAGSTAGKISSTPNPLVANLAAGSNRNLGLDLTNDHPIGFDYTKAVTARNQKNAGVATITELAEITDGFATAVNNDTAYTAAANAKITRNTDGRKIKDVLFEGKTMTCASCHDVHNKENVVQDAGLDTKVPNYFLYAKENKSLICLSCHYK